MARKSSQKAVMTSRYPECLIILFSLFFLGFSPDLRAAQQALAAKILKITTTIHNHQTLSEFKKNFILKELIPVMQNSVLVAEIMAQNTSDVSLTEIKAIDKLWITAEDEMPIHRNKISNKCAKELDKITRRDARFVELFVMDNQGALVCMNNITSDYWQGDEAKWINSFNHGKGGVDIGKVKFDRSAYAKLQQISLPIINKKGSVVGTITFGLNLDKLR